MAYITFQILIEYSIIKGKNLKERQKQGDH